MHTTPPVLIAYDGSPDARAAVKVAGHLFPGAPAVVLYAREPLEAVAAHLESHPATIVEAADAVEAAAIVLGSRGRRRLRATVLGSTSTTVLHHGHRPTLVVPPAGVTGAPRSVRTS
ncbi:universal stress protein, partial [Pseudonocardia sp. KRD-182]|uniref:universal stress protein n=1 Tax=Pseudonocardia oceani TaxID=2792013 RepID=UPI001C49FFDB